MINNIKKSVQDGVLHVDQQLISHQIFDELISFLKSSYLLFTNTTVVTEGDDNILIEGNSLLFSLPLLDADLYIYKEKNTASEFQFEWHGTISEVNLQELYELGLILKNPASLISHLLEIKFKNIDFLFSSEKASYTIVSSRNDLSFSIPEIGIHLKNMLFFYERSLIQAIPSKYLISAEIVLGDTLIPIEIELPANNKEDISCWSLSLSYEVTLENVIKDLLAFISKNPLVKGALGENLESYLPDAIQKFTNCTIEELNISFNPSIPAVYLIKTSVIFNTDWEILPNFIWQNIRLKTFISFHGKEIASTFTISGRFSFIEDWTVGFALKLPLNTTNNWEIYLDGYANLEKIQDLEKLPFIDISKLNIPKEWLIVNNILLDKLEIIFNPIAGKIISVDFAVEMDSESTLIPGITVKNPKLAFTLTFDN